MDSSRFYHPRLNKSSAVRLLLEKGKPGSFLIRKSESQRGNYVLCWKGDNDQVLNITIYGSNEMLVTDEGKEFSTLKNLVSFYMTGEGRGTWRVSGANNIPIELKHPICNTDFLKERWFHGAIGRKEADEKILKTGKENAFLVRSGISTEAEYVLCVESDGTVHHVPIYITEGNKYYMIKEQQFNSLSELIDKSLGNKSFPFHGGKIKLQTPVNATEIPASSVSNRIHQLQKGTSEYLDGFSEEYDMLSFEDESFSCSEGRKEENRKKNRYRNILPYDCSRVVLKVSHSNSEQSDYINANYIKIDDKTWIATQGCVPGTEADFWRMIWQENCRIIVMMTNIVEGGRKKCEQYWGEEKKETFGKVSVKMINETPRKEYVKRMFKISKGGKDKTVCQFHYVKWPDFGVPMHPESTLNFVLEVDQEHQSLGTEHNLIAVHCSAGIGRTGTFIAIHSLVTKIRKAGSGCEISVQKTVAEMRKGRSGMVQTAEQYEHIYDAVEIFVNKMQRQDTPRLPQPQKDASPRNVKAELPLTSLNKGKTQFPENKSKKSKRPTLPPPAVPRPPPPSQKKKPPLSLQLPSSPPQITIEPPSAERSPQHRAFASAAERNDKRVSFQLDDVLRCSGRDDQ